MLLGLNGQCLGSAFFLTIASTTSAQYCVLFSGHTAVDHIGPFLFVIQYFEAMKETNSDNSSGSTLSTASPDAEYALIKNA